MEALSDLIEELRKLNRSLNLLLAYGTVSPDYWELLLIDVDSPVIVPAGEKKVIVDEHEFGRLFSIVVNVNNKNTEVEVRIDDTVAKQTVQGLYNAGMTSFNPSTFWLSKWDEINDVYVACFTPIPWRDYFSHVKVTVYAPSDSAVSFTYSVYRYKLKEEVLQHVKAGT